MVPAEEEAVAAAEGTRTVLAVVAAGDLMTTRAPPEASTLSTRLPLRCFPAFGKATPVVEEEQVEVAGAAAAAGAEVLGGAGGEAMVGEEDEGADAVVVEVAGAVVTTKMKSFRSAIITTRRILTGGRSCCRSMRRRHRAERPLPLLGGVVVRVVFCVFVFFLCVFFFFRCHVSYSRSITCMYNGGGTQECCLFQETVVRYVWLAGWLNVCRVSVFDTICSIEWPGVELFAPQMPSARCQIVCPVGWPNVP